MTDMKVEELRIGNYVYDTEGKVNTVCVETFVKFNYQIQPIPLTEEWLKRFGFEDNVNKYLYKDDGNLGVAVYINENKADWIICNIISRDKEGELNSINIDYNVDLKYVHQLQNLYFALTGTELTILSPHEVV